MALESRPENTRRVIVGMQIEVVRSGDTSAVRVSGRLDAAHAQAFAEALLPVLAALQAPPVLDLSGVEYISSGGLRILLQAAKQAQARGARLTLIQVPDQVYAVLTLSGFATFMTVLKHE
jgi:anti-anti-sigma factor